MDSVAPGALCYERRSHSNNKNADDTGVAKKWDNAREKS